MSFLRRLLGGDASPAQSPDEEPAAPDRSADADDDVLFDAPPPDELIQRQMRYASYAWTPPAQGGERRADDDVDQTERR